MSDEYVTKSNENGERDKFSTGYQRDSSTDKPQLELIPWEALLRWGALNTRGTAKYGYRNSDLGCPFSRVTASLFRHLVGWMSQDNTEDHLAAILWNAGKLIQYQEKIKRGELPAELDDMPRPKAPARDPFIDTILGRSAPPEFSSYYMDKSDPPNGDSGWIVGDKWENRTTGDIYVWNGTEWVKQ